MQINRRSGDWPLYLPRQLLHFKGTVSTQKSISWKKLNDHILHLCLKTTWFPQTACAGIQWMLTTWQAGNNAQWLKSMGKTIITNQCRHWISWTALVLINFNSLFHYRFTCLISENPSESREWVEYLWKRYMGGFLHYCFHTEESKLNLRSRTAARHCLTNQSRFPSWFEVKQQLCGQLLTAFSSWYLIVGRLCFLMPAKLILIKIFHWKCFIR